MNKVFFGWVAEQKKVKTGILSVIKNGIIKLETTSLIISNGMLLFPNLLVYFDEKDKMEYLFNNQKLPDWVKPLIIDEETCKKILLKEKWE